MKMVFRIQKMVPTASNKTLLEKEVSTRRTNGLTVTAF